MQSKAPKVKFILDAKKVGDIGIQLSSYSLSIKDTVDALLKLDDTVLDQELIQKLQKVTPNTED